MLRLSLLLFGTNRASLSCPEQATVAVTQWVAATQAQP
jgi:hypothetical protein